MSNRKMIDNYGYTLAFAPSIPTTSPHHRHKAMAFCHQPSLETPAVCLNEEDQTCNTRPLLRNIYQHLFEVVIKATVTPCSNADQKFESASKRADSRLINQRSCRQGNGV